jgi:ankyrin repeat protein
MDGVTRVALKGRIPMIQGISVMEIRMETSAFLQFIRLVIAGDLDEVARLIRTAPPLATIALPRGATRQETADYFFSEISHYIYAGDTALHMAAAAFSRPMAKMLVSHGADPRARNRRGAEPLHYASDGYETETHAQAEVIEYLISNGADPNAIDKSSVAPLHRAVRRRSLAGVRALLDGGAKVGLPNGSGSTPLHLAVQSTGASGSGSDEAHSQQAEIIRLLLARGAKPTDQDANGKTVEQAATSEWIRELLSQTKKD